MIKLIGRFLVFIILFNFLLIYIGCTSSTELTKRKTHEIILSNKYYNSENSDLLIKIPANWTEVKDNTNRLIDFWLVSPKKNSAIIFVPITFDKENKSTSIKENLQFLLKTEYQLKQNTINSFVLLNKIQTFHLNNLWFSGFRYKVNGNEKRLILFGNGNKYFECIAYYDNNYKPTKDELKYLFNTQNLVLSTVRIRKISNF